MSITDELREWKGNINTRLTPETVLALRSELNCIADRIDREHRMAMEKVAAEADALPMTDESMAEHGWVLLPVDADGVPIRPGDDLVIFETGEHIRAYDIELYADGRWLVCDYETMDSIHPDRLRHRAQTVEDVLREFAYGLGVPVADSYVAATAAKLRLAGEDA